MHVLNVVISMHILDAVTFMHTSNAVVFVDTLDAVISLLVFPVVSIHVVGADLNKWAQSCAAPLISAQASADQI